jgi:hypothetical protein
MHRTFSSINYIFDKTSLNIFKTLQSYPIFSDHSGMKIELKKILEAIQIKCRLLNKEWVTEEVRKEI